MKQDDILAAVKKLMELPTAQLQQQLVNLLTAAEIEKQNISRLEGRIETLLKLGKAGEKEALIQRLREQLQQQETKRKKEAIPHVMDVRDYVIKRLWDKREELTVEQLYTLYQTTK